jgi:hypothetical protein
LTTEKEALIKAVWESVDAGGTNDEEDVVTYVLAALGIDPDAPEGTCKFRYTAFNYFTQPGAVLIQAELQAYLEQHEPKAAEPICTCYSVPGDDQNCLIHPAW